MWADSDEEKEVGTSAFVMVETIDVFPARLSEACVTIIFPELLPLLVLVTTILLPADPALWPFAPSIADLRYAYV